MNKKFNFKLLTGGVISEMRRLSCKSELQKCASRPLKIVNWN